MDVVILGGLAFVAGAWVYWHHVLKPKKPSLAEKYWYYGLLDKVTPPWLKKDSDTN